MASTVSLLACTKADVTLDRAKALVHQERLESLTLEYKEKYSESLIKSVAAMANSYGGLVLVGVTDAPKTDRIVGVDPGAVEQIVNGCFDQLEPPIHPEVIELPLEEKSNKSLVVVRVHANQLPRPILLKGAGPIRLHGRNAVADRTRLQQLFNESPLTTRHAPPLPAPQLGPTHTYEGETLIVLRSGIRLPVGDAANWRALSEESIKELGRVLDRTPLADAMARWCDDLGLTAPGPSRIAGHNRSRRMRLARSTATDHRMVQAITELELPTTYGAPTPELLFTVDIVATYVAESPGITSQGHVVPDASTEPRILTDSSPAKWIPRMNVRRLQDILNALYASLAAEEVSEVLANLADIDSAMVPRPRHVLLKTADTVAAVLNEPKLTPIPGAGDSYGTELTSNPARDPRNETERNDQINDWLMQIALDAGLTGMERLLTPTTTSNDSLNV